MTEQELTNALDNYFRQDRKFIDTSRIPLICQDISNIHRDINEIKENQQIFHPIIENYNAAMWFGKWLVGLASFVAVVTGIILSIKELFKK